MASSRVPCPQCGTLNFAQDALCLGCGARFAPRPAAVPVRAAPQYAPDEMCMRCFGVLLPAAQFDTKNMGGGIENSTGPQYGGGLGTTGMAVRELSGIMWFMDFLMNLLVGGILKKNFDRRLQQALKEAPHLLCCPSCRAIVRR